MDRKTKIKDISLVLVKCCFSLLLVTLIFTNKAKCVGFQTLHNDK